MRTGTAGRRRPSPRRLSRTPLVDVGRTPTLPMTTGRACAWYSPLSLQGRPLHGVPAAAAPAPGTSLDSSSSHAETSRRSR